MGSSQLHTHNPLPALPLKSPEATQTKSRRRRKEGLGFVSFPPHLLLLVDLHFRCVWRVWACRWPQGTRTLWKDPASPAVLGQDTPQLPGTPTPGFTQAGVAEGKGYLKHSQPCGRACGIRNQNSKAFFLRIFWCFCYGLKWSLEGTSLKCQGSCLTDSFGGGRSDWGLHGGGSGPHCSSQNLPETGILVSNSHPPGDTLAPNV